MLKFPHYTQLDSMDCGPTCLRIIAKHYGKAFSLQNLREKCHITREGVSLLGISDAAELIGLRSTGVKVTWEQMQDEVPLPCIVHWNQKHFVVVYKIRKNIVYVSDPASGLLKYPIDKFKKSWLQNHEGEKSKGIALMLEPTAEFYKELGDEDKKLKFSELLHYLNPYKNYLIQLALAMLTATVLSLISPFLTQSVVDKGIGTNDISFVVMILIAQVVLVVGQMANNLIRSWL
ncbi:MAG: cysteine peptidase family C39 domain-containing protein, partial [bacterium]